MTTIKSARRLAAVSCLMLPGLSLPGWGGAAHATEFGQTHVDLGFIDQLGGVPLPQGLYVRDDVEYEFSDDLDDRNGNRVVVNTGVLGKLPLKFMQSTTAEVLTVFYSTGYTIPVINAQLATGLYAAYAWSRAEAQYNLLGDYIGSGENRRGLDDFTFTPAVLQWVIPNTDFFVTLSPTEFTAPTGQYNASDVVGNNIGLNYWSYRPALLVTYLNNGGQEVSINYNMSFNSEDPSTHYKNGDELSFTYLLQQHLNRKLALGIEGYFYTQFTNDTQNGVVVNTVHSSNPFVPFDPLNGGPGNIGQTFAIGPSINYQPTPSIVLNAHFEHEVYALNRARHEILWLRAGYHF